MRCVCSSRTAGSSDAKSSLKPKWFIPFVCELCSWCRHLKSTWVVQKCFFGPHQNICSQIAIKESIVHMVLFGKAGINQIKEKQKDPIKEYLAHFQWFLPYKFVERKYPVLVTFRPLLSASSLCCMNYTLSSSLQFNTYGTGSPFSSKMFVSCSLYLGHSSLSHWIRKRNNLPIYGA